MKLIDSLKLFLNTCRFKIHWLYSTLEGDPVLYPIKILPRKNFLAPIDINTLKKECNLHITRRIDSDQSLNEITFKNGSFKDVIWETQNPQNMSWNLLGKYFKTKYNMFVPGNKGSATWNGEVILPMDTINAFRIEPIHHNAFLPLSKIDGITFPIPLEGKPQQEFLKKTSIEPKPIPDNGVIIMHGEVKIIHNPTRLNYWHVQFTMLDFYGEKMKDKIGSSKVKNFLREDILGKYAKSKMNFENSEIPSRFYVKSIA